jgi:hypothetical protein
LFGSVLRPGEAGYDDARQVWNGMIDRRSALIARCRGVADVINLNARHVQKPVRRGVNSIAKPKPSVWPHREDKYRLPALPGSRSAADGVIWRVDMAWPPTT